MVRKTGRKRGGQPKAYGFRELCRQKVLDPERWAIYLEAVDKALREGNTGPYERLCDMGFGRPPQALEVAGSLEHGSHVEFIATFADGELAFASAPDLSEGVAE